MVYPLIILLSIRRRKAKYKRKKPDDSWKTHKDRAMNLVLDIIDRHPGLPRFKYNNIKIRDQKTRWGSCSSKRNLNFNYRLIFLPRGLAEYIVIHEFCHLAHMNHSKEFWALVEKLSPDYKKHKKLLKEKHIM